jgi:probable O-glycosylation ligase (exosortase A-associated)
MRDLLLVGFLFVAIFYAFRRPYIGVAAWAWIALMAPAEWAFGFSSSFRLNLTIVVVTMVSYLLVEKNKRINISGLSLWVLLFGFWTLVTTVFNLNSDPSWVWAYWNQFWKILLLFLFITIAITKRLHIDTLVWAIVLAISAYAAMEAVKFILSGGGHQISGRAGIIKDRNDFAVAVNMCIPLIIYLAQTTKQPSLKLGLWILFVLNLVSIVGTGSRGGFIGLVVLGIAFWLKSRHKVALFCAALLLVPILYEKTPEEWRDRQATIATAAHEDSSFIGRLWAWKISTMIAMDYPTTGGGFGAVLEPNLWNYYAPRTPYFPPLETPEIPAWQNPKAAHNIYFQVLGDHGFVGLMIFLSILIFAFLGSVGNSRRGRASGVVWYQKLSESLTLSLIGYAITGANVSLAYFDGFYAILGLVTVLTLRRGDLAPMSSGSVRG